MITRLLFVIFTVFVLVSCNSNEPAVTFNVEYKDNIAIKVITIGLEGSAENIISNGSGQTEGAGLGTTILTIKEANVDSISVESEAAGFDCLVDSLVEYKEFHELTLTCAKVGPKAVINESVGLFVNADIPMTVAIDLPSSNFDATDITCTNCNVTNFVNTGDDMNFTFDASPVSDGGVSVQILDNVFLDDVYTVGNSIASNTIDVTYDGTDPTATLGSGVHLTTFATSVFTMSLTLNESVQGLTTSDFDCSNCLIKSMTGFGTSYTIEVDPINTGAVTVNIKASSIFDLAGNTNLVSNTISTTYTAVIPTVVLTSAVGTGTTLPFSVTATFSEDVSGFIESDITCNNCNTSAFAGSGDTYTFTVTPSSENSITVSIPDSASIGDVSAAGNSPSNILATIYDITRPTVTLTTALSNPVKVTPIPITVTFSENVTGFIAADLTVSNGSAGNLNAVSAKVYTVDITPSASGAVTVDLVANKADDIAGNKNLTATQLAITYSNPADDCNGTYYDGFCWFQALNTSCDAICGTESGVHAATRFYAGSHGTRQYCDDVLTSIGNGATNYTSLANMFSYLYSSGCYLDSGDNSMFDTRPTATNVVSKYSICACNKGSIPLEVPEEVENLAAAMSSTNTIELTWESGGGHSYDYLITYGTGASPPADCSSPQVFNSSVEHVTETSVKHVLTGLTPATTYKIRVCASNGAAGFSTGLTTTAVTASVDTIGQASRPNHDNSTSYSPPASTSHSFSHTIAGTANRLLMVAIRGNDTAAADIAVTSVTANGTGLTLLENIDQANNKSELEIWYLINPDSGANTVVVNYGASVATEITASSFNKVHQTTPFGTVYSQDTSTAVESHRLIVSDTAAQDERIYGVIASASQGQSHSTYSPNSVLTADNNSGFGEEYRVIYFGGEAMYHFTTEIFATDYAIILVPLKPL